MVREIIMRRDEVTVSALAVGLLTGSPSGQGVPLGWPKAINNQCPPRGHIRHYISNSRDCVVFTSKTLVHCAWHVT